MARPHPISTKPGRERGGGVPPGPPGVGAAPTARPPLLDCRGPAGPARKGLTESQREVRIRARRRQLQAAMCQFVSDLIVADIVGKEVALATRNRFGTRRGSLREHVQAILREVAEQ